MRNSLLVSQEWCDLVFEHRNKAYGAYALRRQAGHRYRRVLLFLGGIVLLFLLTGGLASYYVYRTIRATVAELEETVKLKPMEAEKGFEVKRLSAGRRAVTVATTPGASAAPPTIVDRRTIAVPMGIDGPDDPVPDEPSTIDDADLHHNADRADLPLEGPQLVKTEVVEELPMYPGGMQALMRFLDDNIIYSGAARRRKVEGEVRVSFIVGTDGTLSDIVVEHTPDDALQRAVLTALRRMPKWKPGRRNGIPTPVKLTLPVRFELS